MKKLILPLLIVCLANCYAQSLFTVYTPTLLPAFPIQSSFVKIATKVTLLNQGSKISGYYSILPFGGFGTKTITVVNHYCDGNLTSGVTIKDTTNIGYLYNGSYVVKFKAYYGTSVMSNCDVADSASYTFNFNVTTVGIENKSKESNTVLIYPNNFTDKFNLTFTNATSAKLQITDCLGKPILNTTLMNNSTEIDLSNYSSGVYYVRIEIDGSYKVVRVIKQ